MFDGLTDSEKLKQARDLFIKASTYDTAFQKEAAEDFAFRDGTQWSQDDKKSLEEERRAALVMNVTKSSVDLIMGVNDDTRIKYKAVPVDPTDGFLCEVVNKLDNWVCQNNDIDGDEDEAVESAAICGRGWVNVDFEADPKNIGHIRLFNTVVPVNEVRKDPSSRKKDLSDAQYVFWSKWLSKVDFRIRYPKLKGRFDRYLKENTLLPPDMVETDYAETPYYDIEYGYSQSDYDREFDAESFYDKKDEMIRVVHMEYWADYKRFYAFNPATGRQEEFDKKDLAALKKAYPVKFGKPFNYSTVMDRKVMWLQFIGNEVIYDGDSPIPYDGFSIVPCFAFSDVSRRTGKHFGFVSLMKDPQREINKRWSQTLNLLNNQVQPGVIAETGAFMDLTQAEEALKSPGGIAIAQEGAIAQKKFMFTSVPQFPAAAMQMEQFSENILRKITGINPDLLGHDRGRQEPGVVIRLRQQQGLTLLKPFFSSVRLMRKETYKRRLSIILKYIPDDQMLQILGQNGRYIIKNGVIFDKSSNRLAPIRDLRNLRYNIEAEEAPGNKSQRMLELSIYVEMMQAGFQVDPKVIINKLDLPEEEKIGWIQYIEGTQKSQQQAMQMKMQLDSAKLQSEVKIETDKTMADAQIKQAKLSEQSNKDEEKFKLEYARLAQDNVKSQRDIAVRNRQVDAQIYAAGRNAGNNR